MYLALYRKYRPATFDDVISQDNITVTLKNQLKNNQTAHAYLFTGSRGTGKTTCAKILAKAVNCLNPVDGNPCLECENCRSIEEGCPDVTEIDAASNSGIDSVRALKDEAVYSPISCKYRVYIIDEVHAISPAAFNALLKLIEEPPPHVVFIFATTEIHKIPATILSRCQRFEFRRIDINDSKNRLLQIAKKENVDLDEDAAFLISKISDGGMRDALSLLDRCCSIEGKITTDVVRESAGVSGSGYLFKIADEINKNNTAEVLRILDELINSSKDVTRLIEELIAHYRSLMLLKAGADNSIIRATSEDITLYKNQAERYTLEEIMRSLDILSETFSSMGRVKTPSLLCEMCLIRLCTPKLDINEKALSIRIDALEKKLLETVNSIKCGEIKVSKSNVTEVINEPVAENNTEFNVQEAEIPHEEYIPEEAPVSEEIPVPEEVKEQASEDTVTDEEGFTEFSEWSEILPTVPFSIRILIGDTTAKINNNTVIIEGTDLAVDFATVQFRKDITEAIRNKTGKTVTLIGKKKENESLEQVSKVKEFLDFAGSQGVKIKVN